MTEQTPIRPNRLAWTGIGTGVVALVFSLFSWTSADIPGSAQNVAYDRWNSAWSSGFTAWASVLLLVLAGVVAYLQLPRARAALSTAWLVLAGLAVLLILFRWVSADSVIADNIDVSGDKLDQLESIAGASVGSGFGLIITLLAAVVSTVAAWFTLRASRS